MYFSYFKKVVLGKCSLSDKSLRHDRRYLYILHCMCFLNILFIYIFRVSPVVIKYVKLYKVKIKKTTAIPEVNDKQSTESFFFNHSKREGSLFIVKILTVFPIVFYFILLSKMYNIIFLFQNNYFLEN